MLVEPTQAAIVWGLPGPRSGGYGMTFHSRRVGAIAAAQRR